MNKLFYSVIALVVIAVVVLVSVNNESTQAVTIHADRQEITANDDSVQQEAEMYKEENESIQDGNDEFNKHLNSNATTVEATNNTPCIINKGEFNARDCQSFSGLKNMDFSRFENLKLNDSFEQMVNKGNIKLKSNSFVQMLEIGETENEKIYMAISYSIPSFEESYFFDIQLHNAAVLVNESQINITEDDIFTEVVLENGFSMAYLNSTNVNCADQVKINFLKELNVDVTELMTCDEFTEIESINETLVEHRELDVNCDFQLKPGFDNNEVFEPVNVITAECSDLNINLLQDYYNIENLIVYGMNLDSNILSNFQKLKTIKASYYSIVNLEALSTLNNLKTLEVKESRVINTNLLDFLNVQFERLIINESEVDDFTFLENQTKLYNLRIYNNGLTSIPNIGSVDSLLELDLSKNEIEDITGLEQYSNLEKINLRHNNIKYMSNLNVNGAVLKDVNLTFNPLDCEDPNLEYSQIVKSSCNRKLKK